MGQNDTTTAGQEARKRWHKLLALCLGLAILLAGVAIVSMAPLPQSIQAAGCYTAFATAVTTIVTGYVAGNIAEHQIVQRAKTAIVGALSQAAPVAAEVKK
jgi:hypothetical protein